MILTKDEIKDVAIEYLSWTGFECWKQSNNSGKRWKNNVKRGIPDILGFERNSQKATFMACEVKTLSDKLSKFQKDFLTNLTLKGGHAFIACQINDKAEVIPFTEYIKPNK